MDELAETDSDGGLVGQMLGLHLGAKLVPIPTEARIVSAISGAIRIANSFVRIGKFRIICVHCLSGGSHRWHESLRRASLLGAPKASCGSSAEASGFYPGGLTGL